MKTEQRDERKGSAGVTALRFHGQGRPLVENVSNHDCGVRCHSHRKISAQSSNSTRSWMLWFIQVNWNWSVPVYSIIRAPTLFLTHSHPFQNILTAGGKRGQREVFVAVPFSLKAPHLPVRNNPKVHCSRESHPRSAMLKTVMEMALRIHIQWLDKVGKRVVI